MARPLNKLSAADVAAIKRRVEKSAKAGDHPNIERGFYSDGGGLYLQVAPGGSLSWVFRFKEGGKARDMGLGPLHTLTLADARAKATDCRKLRLDGIDPIVKRQQDKTQRRYEAAKAITFEQCAKAYIADHTDTWKNDKHRDQWSATLEEYAYPIIGKLSARDIDTGLIVKVLKQEKTKDGKNGPLWVAVSETASRLRGRIETVLNWATAHGHRNDQNGHAMPNPARWKGNLDHLLPKRSKVSAVKHFDALPYTEIGAFVADLRKQDGVAPLALQFTILNAARTNETIEAKWPEFDLAKKLWTIPGERMKSGREHRVPLTDASLTILKNLTTIKRDDYVFPGRVEKKPLSNMAMLQLLRRMRGQGKTVHGFRSTFKDWARERTNFPNQLSEAALAHINGDKVEAAYARGDLFVKRRKLMEAWAAYCAAAETVGEVISINQRVG
jgi:integrase